MAALIECVPNFSEGRDRRVIDAIAEAIAGVSGVKLLDVDPGADTNRTVYTFVGEPAAVTDAAFRAAARAVNLIDMTAHRGAHPRIGSMDVCPIVPVAGITMGECAQLARDLGARIGRELGVPVYFYEHAATRDARRSLAAIRTGEYENLPQKLADPEWTPDAGPATFVPRAGAFVVGAREFLLAYNVNLNTTDARLANAVALAVREAGRVKRDASGATVLDDQRQPVRVPGRLRAVRAIGWYIEQYRQAQVSVNLLDFRTTPLHVVFDTICEEAAARGLRVTGSELVGLCPLEPLVEAGRHYLRQQHKSDGAPERDVVEMAVRSLGLNDLAPFEPAKKIIEFHFRPPRPLAGAPVGGFVDDVSTDRPTPGGGSVAALSGSLAAALAAMVANLAVGRAGSEGGGDASSLARRAQSLKEQLVAAIDGDAAAFDAVLEAMRLPRATPEQQEARSAAIERASREASRVPLDTTRLCADATALAADVAMLGLRASASDAGVAACIGRAAAESAALNVVANLESIHDEALRGTLQHEAAGHVERAHANARRALTSVGALLPVQPHWLLKD